MRSNCCARSKSCDNKRHVAALESHNSYLKQHREKNVKIKLWKQQVPVLTTVLFRWDLQRLAAVRDSSVESDLTVVDAEIKDIFISNLFLENLEHFLSGKIRSNWDFILLNTWFSWNEMRKYIYWGLSLTYSLGNSLLANLCLQNNVTNFAFW